MLEHDLLQKNPVAQFVDGVNPHFVIEDPLNDTDMYEYLHCFFPDMLNPAIPENTAIRIKALTAFDRKDINPVWKQVFRDCVSDEFCKRMFKIFEEPYKRFYGEDHFNRHMARTPAVRVTTKAHELCTECQFVINTPSEGGTTVRVPHVDNPREIYALLWYFRDPKDDSEGGNLELFRHPGEKVNYFGHYDVHPDDLEHVATVKYQSNVLVGFLNGWKSIHAVSNRAKTDHPRKYINIIAEQREPLFKAWKT